MKHYCKLGLAVICLPFILFTLCSTSRAQSAYASFGTVYGAAGNATAYPCFYNNGGYDYPSGGSSDIVTNAGTVSLSLGPIQPGSNCITATFYPNSSGGTISGSTTIEYVSEGGGPNLYVTVSVSGTSVIATAQAIPKYKVTSIIYAPPGNNSSNGFTNSTTNGTTTSIGSSFTAGTSTTFSYGFTLGGSLGLTFGTSSTTGNSSAFTETFSSGTGVSNGSNPVNPNAIDHHQDMLLIWLNPTVSASQTGPDSVSYGVSTQIGANGQAEQVDTVEVFAVEMQANAQGVTTVPVNALTQQLDPANGQYDLPGLANICAHAIYYPNQCTQTNQCGCVPSDFASILTQDPLLRKL